LLGGKYIATNAVRWLQICMTDICLREKVKRDQVTLHSDNGSPMKGATMLATLQELGVMP